MSKSIINYPKIGRCIYCPETDGLSREHIVPYFLGGRMELKDASCDKCADITKKFEQTCAHDIFGPLRLISGIRGRHKNKRPTHLEVVVEYPDRTETVKIPVDEYPVVSIPMPILPPPGLRVGRTEQPRVMDLQYEKISVSTLDRYIGFRDQLADLGATTAHVPMRFQFNAFLRLLAKIAHGITVANFGLGSFEPMLPDLILGQQDNNLGHLIGGTDASMPTDNEKHSGPKDGEDFHKIAVARIPINGSVFMVCRIQLFCVFDMPVYEVIVGRP